MVKIIFLCVGALLLLPLSAYAAAETGVESEYEDFIDALPDDILELLPDGFSSGNISEAADSVGELTSWEYMLDTLVELVGFDFGKIIGTFASLCATLVLCALIRAALSGSKSSALSATLTLVCGGAVGYSAAELSRTPIEAAFGVLERIRQFVNISSPLACGLYAIGGNVTSALVNNYGFIVFLSILENVFVFSLRGVVGVCMALAIASALISDTNLLSLCEVIKSVFGFFVGATMLVFTAVISAQNLLSAKADSLSAKTAKLLASHMIPLVGSTIGESLRTAGASVEYLRTNVGVFLIIVLVLTVLPTILSVVAYRLVFGAAVSVAELLGCKRESRLLSEISGIYGYVLAILSFCSVMLLFLLTALTKCASPLGG